MTFRKTILSLAVLLLATAPLGLAQGTYTQIDVPGTTGTTVCTAIDTAGDIVGDYEDNTGLHGFLLKGGSYTTIDYPGSNYIRLTGMNDLGQIVGMSFGPQGTPLGFEYDVATQTFTTIKYPGARYTYPNAINNAGAIAGYFERRGLYSGFELKGSSYRAILPPMGASAYVLGISGPGEMMIGYVPSGYNGYNNYNFLFRSGEYYPLEIPGNDSQDTTVLGINDSGTALVGYHNTEGGFIYQGKKNYQVLQFPGGTGTIAYGVNDSGVVVGGFLNSPNGHGFIWTPSAAAEKK